MRSFKKQFEGMVPRSKLNPQLCFKMEIGEAVKLPANRRITVVCAKTDFTHSPQSRVEPTTPLLPYFITDAKNKAR